MQLERLRKARFGYRVGSWLLVGAMLCLAMLVAWVFGGSLGISILAGLLVTTHWLAPRMSAQKILGSHGARPVRPYEVQPLQDWVRLLANKAGLKKVPRLFWLGEGAPEAMATGEGRDAAIALSPTLLRDLGPRHLAAVLAHEVSHIRGNDLRLTRFASMVGVLTRQWASWGWLLFVVSLPFALMGGSAFPWWAPVVAVGAPAAVTLAFLALSRLREFDADAGAAALLGDPLAMAEALVRLESASQLGVVRWLPLEPVRIPTWLRTHPSTRERVRRLRALARAPRPRASRPTEWPVHSERRQARWVERRF